MGYSRDALAFSTIPAGHQVRLEDRVSFLYLERCMIRQDRTGVIAVRAATPENDETDFTADDPALPAPLSASDDERGPEAIRLQLPVASLGVLCLGPGTSISHAAMTSCARSGCSVIFSGGGGINAYSHATPLTSSARWAIAQATLISSKKFQKEAAAKLYKRQFGLDEMPGDNLRAMRGMEGRLMRNAYREAAEKAGIKRFHRDSEAADPVNAGLNVANSILYGVAGTVCAAIGVNPALGIIHRGNVRALQFDLADLYKANTVIPLVFARANSTDPISAIRRDLRKEIYRKRIMAGMLDALMNVLEPYLPERDDDRLIADRGEVEGHVQYGGSR